MASIAYEKIFDTAKNYSSHTGIQETECKQTIHTVERYLQKQHNSQDFLQEKQENFHDKSPSNYLPFNWH